MTKKWTNYTSGQRIETSDAVHTAVDAPIQAIQAISDLILGDDEQRNYVVSGFECSVEGSTLTVNRGVALVGFRRKGEVQHGMVLSGGPAQKTVDISAAQPGDNIYVRFELSEGESENRLFWNPLDADPAETPKNVPTRLVEDWSVAVGSSPGEEWVKIARYAGSQTVLTDWHGRDLLWDPRNTVSGYFWGSDADRTGPIESLKDVIWGLQAQVSSIIGEEDWRSRVTSMLRRDGSRSLLGDLLPDEAGRRSLGSLTAPFKKLFSQALELVPTGQESRIAMGPGEDASEITADHSPTDPSSPGSNLKIKSARDITLEAPQIVAAGDLRAEARFVDGEERTAENRSPSVGDSSNPFYSGHFNYLNIGDDPERPSGGKVRIYDRGINWSATKNSLSDTGYAITVDGSGRPLVLGAGVYPRRSEISVYEDGENTHIDLTATVIRAIGSFNVGRDSGAGIGFLGVVSATLPSGISPEQTSTLVVVNVPFSVTSSADAHEYMVLGHSKGSVIKDVRLHGIYRTNGVNVENTLAFRVELYAGLALSNTDFNILLAR